MTSSLIVSILLFAAVAIALASCIGLLAMQELNQRLHYLAPLSTLSAFLIVAAVIIAEGLSQSTIKAVIAAVALALANPILTHATARAAYIRKLGHWAPQPNEDERQAGD